LNDIQHYVDIDCRLSLSRVELPGIWEDDPFLPSFLSFEGRGKLELEGAGTGKPFTLLLSLHASRDQEREKADVKHVENL